MSIAIAKGDEELAVINLSLLAQFGYKKYEPIIESRGFKIISSSEMGNQDSYKLGFKKSTGILDLGIITFASDNAQSILQNAFSDYDFVLSKIISGNEPIVKDKPKPEITPEKEKKPDNTEIPDKPQQPNNTESPEKTRHPDNTEIRQKLLDKAKEYIGSKNWSKWRKRTSFDGLTTFKIGETKCNLFIYEVLKQCGIDLGLPNDYGKEVIVKRPYVCKQWYNEEVPYFKCIGKGIEALKKAKPGDIITNGSHIGIISGQKNTIRQSSKAFVNKVVENDEKRCKG